MRNSSANGRRSRRKGHNFEREVAIRFREVGFSDARRHLEYQDEEANGVDLINTGCYRVQCKKLRKYAPITAIEEVTADEFLGEVPVLVTAGDNQRPVAVLPLEEFLRLIST